MENCYLYHCNAYTYGDPTWFPDMPEELRAMYNKVTKGSLSGNAGQAAHEDFKINGQYVDQPGKPVTLHGVTYLDGVVGITFLDKYVEASRPEVPRRRLQESQPAVLHQYQLRIRDCSGEVASHAFWQITRFALGGFRHLAKPASAPVRTLRSTLLPLIPLQFGSRVFS
jgi:hypothetical protein